MKKLLNPALALAVLAVFIGLSVVQGAQQKPAQKSPSTGVAATILICKRTAIPAHTEPVERCHGNWMPTDNTNNWTYKAVQGPDHFTRSNGTGERSCAKCPNGGSIQQDFQGLQDWCVKQVPAVTAATATPSCRPGFAWDIGLNMCFSPGRSEKVLRVFDRCHGNWTPLDNTNNWTYQALKGPDRFTRSSGGSGERACTKCPNGGSIRQDYKGLEDWCLDYQPGVPSATVAGTCPQGFTLGPM